MDMGDAPQVVLQRAERLQVVPQQAARLLVACRQRGRWRTRRRRGRWLTRGRRDRWLTRWREYGWTGTTGRQLKGSLDAYRVDCVARGQLDAPGVLTHPSLDPSYANERPQEISGPIHLVLHVCQTVHNIELTRQTHPVMPIIPTRIKG